MDISRTFSISSITTTMPSSRSIGGSSSSRGFAVASPKTGRGTSASSAKAELSLLADLLGVGAGGGAAAKEGGGAKGGGDGADKLFKINLFPNQGFSSGGGGSGHKGTGGAADDDDDVYRLDGLGPMAIKLNPPLLLLTRHVNCVLV